jgi:hypothetical protein
MVGNPSQCDVDGDCDCAPGLLSGKGFCAGLSEFLFVVADDL